MIWSVWGQRTTCKQQFFPSTMSLGNQIQVPGLGSEALYQPSHLPISLLLLLWPRMAFCGPVWPTTCVDYSLSVCSILNPISRLCSLSCPDFTPSSHSSSWQWNQHAGLPCSSLVHYRLPTTLQFIRTTPHPLISSVWPPLSPGMWSVDLRMFGRIRCHRHIFLKEHLSFNQRSVHRAPGSEVDKVAQTSHEILICWFRFTESKHCWAVHFHA